MVIFEPMVVEVFRAKSLDYVNPTAHRAQPDLSKELPSGSHYPIIFNKEYLE